MIFGFSASEATCKAVSQTCASLFHIANRIWRYNSVYSLFAAGNPLSEPFRRLAPDCSISQTALGTATRFTAFSLPETAFRAVSRTCSSLLLIANSAWSSNSIHSLFAARNRFQSRFANLHPPISHRKPRLELQLDLQSFRCPKPAFRAVSRTCANLFHIANRAWRCNSVYCLFAAGNPLSEPFCELAPTYFTSQTALGAETRFTASQSIA